MIQRCNEIVEQTVSTHFNEKKQSVKHKMSIFCFAFLLITIALLIVNSIYCYLIKRWAKRKHFLPIDNTNNELKELIYWYYQLKISGKIKDINRKKQ